MGGQVMSLYTSQASKIQRRLSPYIPISIRGYSERSKTDIKKSNLIDEERASSTAEVFRKVAEERTAAGRGAGVAPDVEKAESVSDSTETHAKEAYKEPPGNVNSG